MVVAFRLRCSRHIVEFESRRCPPPGRPPGRLLVCRNRLVTGCWKPARFPNGLAAPGSCWISIPTPSRSPPGASSMRCEPAEMASATIKVLARATRSARSRPAL